MFDIYKKFLDIASQIGSIRECKFKENPERWQDTISITCESGNTVVEISVSVKHSEEEASDDS